MAKYRPIGVETFMLEFGPATESRIQRRIEPPIKTTQRLIDKLVTETQRYGDQPPVIVLNGERYSIGRVEICGGRDHILLEAIPEGQ